MTETNIIDLENLYNFIVDNFYICIRLGSKILILKLDEHKTRTKNILNMVFWF